MHILSGAKNKVLAEGEVLMSIKAVKIDNERCIGCGSCAVVAPDVFILNVAEGKAKVKEGWEKVSPEDLRSARDICPVQAIVLEEG